MSHLGEATNTLDVVQSIDNVENEMTCLAQCLEGFAGKSFVFNLSDHMCSCVKEPISFCPNKENSATRLYHSCNLTCINTTEDIQSDLTTEFSSTEGKFNNQVFNLISALICCCHSRPEA